MVFLAPRDAEAARVKAGDLGASAFVPHARAGNQLGAVISSLLNKGSLQPEFQPGLDDQTSVPRLTPREQDLLRGLDSGHSLREIARELGVSETTLKGYARDLYAKLGAHSRGEAVHAARGDEVCSPTVSPSPQGWGHPSQRTCRHRPNARHCVRGSTKIPRRDVPPPALRGIRCPSKPPPISIRPWQVAEPATPDSSSSGTSATRKSGTASYFRRPVRRGSPTD